MYHLLKFQIMIFKTKTFSSSNKNTIQQNVTAITPNDPKNLS
jgi:hypothetical protein